MDYFALFIIYFLKKVLRNNFWKKKKNTNKQTPREINLSINETQNIARNLFYTTIHRSKVNRELMQRRRRWRQQERKKNRLRLAKHQLCTCIRLFCTFLSRRCKTTTWNCLISRFVENVNTRQRLPFSFSELWYSPLKLISRKIHQHLTNWTRWNKRDKVWSSEYSLFKWRFRSRRRRCLLKLPNTVHWSPDL